jgi:hypothetical protein
MAIARTDSLRFVVTWHVMNTSTRVLVLPRPVSNALDWFPGSSRDVSAHVALTPDIGLPVCDESEQRRGWNPETNAIKIKYLQYLGSLKHKPLAASSVLTTAAWSHPLATATATAALSFNTRCMWRVQTPRVVRTFSNNRASCVLHLLLDPADSCPNCKTWTEQQSCFWEAVSRSAGQEVPRLLWHCCVRNSPPLHPNLVKDKRKVVPVPWRRMEE